MATTTTPKIYCFINSRPMHDWLNVVAIAEDGHCLAGHVSSSEAFAKHDIGVNSDWKHDGYRDHYPAGYELEWVDDPKKHEGLLAAFELHQAMRDPDDDESCKAD